MDAESRGMPPLHYHFYEGIIYQSFLFQHLEYMSTEKLGQWTEIHLRHNKKIAALQEEAVGHQGMEMGMPSGVISERLNSHNHSRNTGFLAKGKLEEFRQTFCSTLAELAQQFPVVEKESAQDFGNGKNVLTMGDWIKNRFLEVVSELDHFLVVAGGTGKRPQGDSETIFLDRKTPKCTRDGNQGILSGRIPGGGRRTQDTFELHGKLPADKSRIAAENNRHSALGTQESGDRAASTRNSPAVFFARIF